LFTPGVVAFTKPTLDMVVTVGAELLDVKSVAWYSMSTCSAKSAKLAQRDPNPTMGI
jgi:hypothetical protein